MPPLAYCSNERFSLDYSGDESFSESPIQTVDRPRKSVSFSDAVQVKKALHINNYTEDEINATWYNESDYHQIREEIEFTADLINLGFLNDDSVAYSRRGLEYQTPLGARRRRTNKVNSYCAVLDEQDIQWEAGYDHPELIAKAYSVASYHCQAEANLIALQDEKSARR